MIRLSLPKRECLKMQSQVVKVKHHVEDNKVGKEANVGEDNKVYSKGELDPNTKMIEKK